MRFASTSNRISCWLLRSFACTFDDNRRNRRTLINNCAQPKTRARLISNLNRFNDFAFLVKQDFCQVYSRFLLLGWTLYKKFNKNSKKKDNRAIFRAVCRFSLSLCLYEYKTSLVVVHETHLCVIWCDSMLIYGWPSPYYVCICVNAPRAAQTCAYFWTLSV